MTPRPPKSFTGERGSVRAAGGTTGYSDWSDPTSHRCL